MTESLLRGFWEGFLPWEELSQLLRRKRPGGVPRGTAVGGASASESTWTEPLGDGRGAAHAEARWRCPPVPADIVVGGGGFAFAHRNLNMQKSAEQGF